MACVSVADTSLSRDAIHDNYGVGRTADMDERVCSEERMWVTGVQCVGGAGCTGRTPAFGRPARTSISGCRLENIILVSCLSNG